MIHRWRRRAIQMQLHERIVRRIVRKPCRGDRARATEQDAHRRYRRQQKLRGERERRARNQILTAEQVKTGQRLAAVFNLNERATHFNTMRRAARDTKFKFHERPLIAFIERRYQIPENASTINHLLSVLACPMLCVRFSLSRSFCCRHVHTYF